MDRERTAQGRTFELRGSKSVRRPDDSPPILFPFPNCWLCLDSNMETNQLMPLRPEAPTNRGEGPLFVVGMWRSGTSLLYALLNQHPDIGLMYEDDLMLLRAMFPGGKAKRDWVTRWEFWNSAPSRHKLQLTGWGESRPSLKAALEFCYRHSGTAIWGAKSPNYYDCMTAMADIFPQARFLIIWRDLPSICSSVIRAGNKPSWFSRTGMIHRTIMGYREMKRERDRITEAGHAVLEIHYRDLVSDPETTMKRICAFLRIPFTPEMCSLRKADRSAIFEHSHHEMVNGAKIVSSRQRPDVLSPAIKNKIARYTNLWTQSSPDQWPHYQVTEAEARKPGLLERSGDGLIYRILRAYDSAIRLLYCYAPIRLLQGYRSLKSQLQAAKSRVADSETVLP